MSLLSLISTVLDQLVVLQQEYHKINMKNQSLVNLKTYAQIVVLQAYTNFPYPFDYLRESCRMFFEVVCSFRTHMIRINNALGKMAAEAI